MKRVLLLVAIPLALVYGQDNKDAQAKTKRPPNVPEGAVQLDDYTWRFTDAQGKKWMYRATPFGVQKWEDKPVPATAPPPVDNTNPVVMTDLGDSVRFQWTSPFGTQTWIRKKSELTDDEKAMIEREKNKRQPPDPLAVTKAADAKKADTKAAGSSGANRAEKQSTEKPSN